MKTVCQKDMCSGCGVCIESCFKNAIILNEDVKAYNAVINKDLCVNCNKCHNVCPKNNPAPLVEPSLWQQGWSLDDSIRAKGSSGGLATAISTSFIKEGGAVCTCKFLNGRFDFYFIKVKVFN